MGRRKRENREKVSQGFALPFTLAKDSYPCGGCGTLVPRVRLRPGEGAVFREGRVLCINCQDRSWPPLPWRLSLKCEAPECKRSATEGCFTNHVHVHLFCLECHLFAHTQIDVSSMLQGEPPVGDPMVRTFLCSAGIQVCERCIQPAQVSCECADRHKHHFCEDHHRKYCFNSGWVHEGNRPPVGVVDPDHEAEDDWGEEYDEEDAGLPDDVSCR